MKCLIFFVLVVAAVASAQMDPEMKQQMMAVMTEIATNCAKQENANPEELTNLMAKKVPTTKEGKCLLACFNEHVKMQTPDGKMNLDGALGTIEVFKEPAPQVYEAMVAVFKKCFPETEHLSDRCDVAGKFAECAASVSHEMGLDAALGH